MKRVYARLLTMLLVLALALSMGTAAVASGEAGERDRSAGEKKTVAENESAGETSPEATDAEPAEETEKTGRSTGKNRDTEKADEDASDEPDESASDEPDEDGAKHRRGRRASRDIWEELMALLEELLSAYESKGGN